MYYINQNIYSFKLSFFTPQNYLNGKKNVDANVDEGNKTIKLNTN